MEILACFYDSYIQSNYLCYLIAFKNVYSHHKIHNMNVNKEENIDLTEAHWEVVRFVRAFYEEYETSPAIRALVKAMANKFGPEKGNSRYLQRLFKKGPAKQATKLAGLPKPAKCL